MLGIEKFKSYFKGYEEEYVIIGGTACELLMESENLSFRATKDIDIVLIVEVLTKEFGKTFWNFVKEAGYQHINKGSGKTQFYRFSSPRSSEFPFMIELFSKNEDWLSEKNTTVITPIHIDDDVSSLSAILLNETYYEFLLKGVTKIDSLSILNAEHIIPFKVKAWLDLSKRKATGEHVDSRDIKKHKNDVFRLSMLLRPNQKVELFDEIKEDMVSFLKEIKEENIDLKQLGIKRRNKEEIIEMFYEIYNLDS